MHYSRTQPLTDGHRYIYSTAIFLNEVMKLALSLTILMYDISRTLPPQTPATVLFEQLYNSVFSGDGWKMAFPATLYTLLNSLQYIAVSNIDAVHFQIIYQLKVGFIFKPDMSSLTALPDPCDGSVQLAFTKKGPVIKKMGISCLTNYWSCRCPTTLRGFVSIFTRQERPISIFFSEVATRAGTVNYRRNRCSKRVDKTRC